MSDISDVANKMIDCREMCRRTFSDGYSDKIDPWKELIKKVSEVRKVSLAEAGLMVAKENDQPIITAIIMAACCDLAEGI